MKKVSYIFIVIHIFIASAYAELSKEQMKQYWENSRAEHMFLHEKNNLERDILLAAQIKKEDVRQVLQDTIDTFINNPKYLEEYKSTFFSIDSSVYKELDKFYSTNVGKKYRKVFNSLNYMSMNDSRKKYRAIDNSSNYMTEEDIRIRYKELMKKNIISDEKMKLISNIDKELNLLEIKTDFKRSFMEYKYQTVYPEHNVTNKSIDKFMTEYKLGMKKYEAILMPVLYSDFSMDELKEILSMASSKILAIEVEYIYKAILEFTKLSYMDLKKDYKRLAMISYCQRFSTSSAFIPEDCKTEWLND